MTTHTPHAAPSSVRDDVADQELKARHRALWALGDYPSIAATVIPSLRSFRFLSCRGWGSP